MKRNLGPAKDISFSLKNSSFNVAKRINQPSMEKLYVEKKDLKVTKNDFSDMKFWLSANISFFDHDYLKKNKVCAKNYI